MSFCVCFMTAQLMTFSLTRFTNNRLINLSMILRSLKIVCSWSFRILFTSLRIFRLIEPLINVDEFILYLTGSKAWSFKKEAFETFFKNGIEFQTKSWFATLLLTQTVRIMIVNVNRFLFIEKLINKMSKLFLSVYFMVIKRFTSECIYFDLKWFVSFEKVLSGGIKFWRIHYWFHCFTLLIGKLCFFHRFQTIKSLFLLYNQH